jgi:Protein of unknown function (DUF3788)
MAVKTAKQEVKAPSMAELHRALGKSTSAWPGIISGLEERYSPLELEWRASQLEFGRMCLIRHKDRTLLYLTPMAGQLLVGVVLGERAYGLAMASKLRAAIKKMLTDARPYAEGRGIRFVVKSASDVAQVLLLIECKMTPK